MPASAATEALPAGTGFLGGGAPADVPASGSNTPMAATTVTHRTRDLHACPFTVRSQPVFRLTGRHQLPSSHHRQHLSSRKCCQGVVDGKPSGASRHPAEEGDLWELVCAYAPVVSGLSVTETKPTATPIWRVRG